MGADRIDRMAVRLFGHAEWMLGRSKARYRLDGDFSWLLPTLIANLPPSPLISSVVLLLNQQWTGPSVFLRRQFGRSAAKSSGIPDEIAARSKATSLQSTRIPCVLSSDNVCRFIG
ncbi:hypothetical protein C5Y97_22835 [Blastopirellula marina]|uniref:Uncharacterized protein n=1 Tax=Blastopirellula marina TaxID=124 RepID=A0A2S8FA79_9BACT|nr:hypothetical protein C5Y98_22825 [Blastopirellula marina]PTL42314.1 hypothetical protein C5Y97_22835 [Blastopirellula marina]